MGTNGQYDVYTIFKDEEIFLGILKPLPLSVEGGHRYAMECKQPGHRKCCRTRTWSPNSGEDVEALEKGLVSWAIHGLQRDDVKSKQDHVKLERS